MPTYRTIATAVLLIVFFAVEAVAGQKRRIRIPGSDKLARRFGIAVWAFPLTDWVRFTSRAKPPARWGAITPETTTRSPAPSTHLALRSAPRSSAPPATISAPVSPPIHWATYFSPGTPAPTRRVTKDSFASTTPPRAAVDAVDRPRANVFLWRHQRRIGQCVHRRLHHGFAECEQCRRIRCLHRQIRYRGESTVDATVRHNESGRGIRRFI